MITVFFYHYLPTKKNEASLPRVNYSPQATRNIDHQDIAHLSAVALVLVQGRSHNDKLALV